MNHPEMNRTAGAATPRGPKAEKSVERNLSLRDGNMNACSCTILDARLDDLIAIADLTGATLDDVVRLVWQVPEPIFAATVHVIAALAGPPSPTDLPGLLQQHRAATDRIAEAETDADIAEIDAQIDAIERQIMSTPARTPAEAYLKLMAILPEICVDLRGPTLAPLRDEIAAMIGGGGVTMTINLKESMGTAYQVLRYSERVVQQSVDWYRSTPEKDGDYYDPDWRVELEQDEAEGLLRNLREGADLFQILAENAEAAADLLAAHRAAQESPQGPPKEGAEVLPLRFESDEEA